MDSARGAAADRVEEGMMPAGAPFLKKPFSPEELASRVRAVLERR
jgi:DNA-binding response OmpR family regulator